MFWLKICRTGVQFPKTNTLKFRCQPELDPLNLNLRQNRLDHQGQVFVGVIPIRTWKLLDEAEHQALHGEDGRPVQILMNFRCETPGMKNTKTYKNLNGGKNVKCRMTFCNCNCSMFSMRVYAYVWICVNMCESYHIQSPGAAITNINMPHFKIIQNPTAAKRKAEAMKFALLYLITLGFKTNCTHLRTGQDKSMWRTALPRTSESQQKSPKGEVTKIIMSITPHISPALSVCVSSTSPLRRTWSWQRPRHVAVASGRPSCLGSGAASSAPPCRSSPPEPAVTAVTHREGHPKKRKKKLQKMLGFDSHPTPISYEIYGSRWFFSFAFFLGPMDISVLAHIPTWQRGLHRLQQKSPQVVQDFAAVRQGLHEPKLP